MKPIAIIRRVGDRRSNDGTIRVAATVISKSDREHQADAVLRMELKRAGGISREQGRDISRAVFAYYRWLGWLEERTPVEKWILRALELDGAFQTIPGAIPEAEFRRAVPDWATEQMEISAEWLRTLQREPKLWLRAKVGQGDELANKLGSTRGGGHGLPDAILYKGMEDLFRTAEFHAGEFELQDISSQAVGILCEPQPGETWWDACAGEGGKMLHLGDLMRGKGLIWASDRAEWRLQKLKRRAARARVFNYRAVSWDGGAKLPTKTKFDGILVDAPCSGTGTWQRNPQSRWTTTPLDVAELATLQKQLLANAVPALKPGGRLIYSVCTLTRAETVEVQEEITKQFAGLEPMALKNPLDGAQSE
ncbi:MAG TPA: RsmB/NOP family class I SAM-dependent RNA methyltransferase, partial [Verrucomicrobiae bacterium]|nr:RsmB/NOP family class I SAM-dependent RNA methyltransferase [Verrucomicrobiae bacterium]